jgi:hypothetical protein
MSVVQAGLAFRAARPIDDFAALLSRIYAADVEELSQPSLERFDPRRPGDVMVLTFHDACFVCNLDLGLRAIDASAAETAVLHDALGAPATMLAFCHDDSRNRHGYALVTRGRAVRRRMQTAPGTQAHGAGPGSTGADSAKAASVQVVEQGAPQPFERRWLAAAHFVEEPEAPGAAPRRVHYLGDREILVPEQELTGRLLRDALEALFGVCPWDTLITPSYRFFRAAAGAGEAEPPQPLRTLRPRAPWWQRLWR